MKYTVKLLALMLALLTMLSCVMLTSCDSNNGPADTTPSDSSTDPQQPDDTTTGNSGSVDDIPESKDLELVTGAVPGFTIIRDEDLDNTSTSVSCASELRTYIGKLIDSEGKVMPGILTDWKKPTEEYNHDSIEVLVGFTDYSETQQVLSELSLGEYAVKVVGRKLVVTGYTDESISAACTELKGLVKDLYKDGSLVIPADTNITGVTSEMLNELPGYENGTFSASYLCGNSATELIFKDTTPEAYSAYIGKLEQSGFTTYTTNTITNNSFATLTNASYTVNAGYYDYEKSSRIIIEKLADPVGLKEDNVYTAVTTSQITMFGLEYNNGSENRGNGLSMLIRMTDGRFIVIDGGFTNRAADAQLLVNALKEQSADYITSGQKITIAAWIITHAHGDHSGMITSQYGYFKSMKVEKFIVNFLSELERNKAISSTSYSGNWSNNEGSGWKNVATAAKSLGAKVQYVRVGQVFYMADVTMEILYTIDSYGPKVCNAFNTTSLIIKFTFGDGTTFLMTGDATGNGFQIAAKMYGTYLKCDILQVAHHGYTTWGNDSGTISAYNYAAPSTLLWPQGSTAFPKYKNKGYNVVLFSKDQGGSNANFKECYVAGREGESVIIPIPYSVGNAIVKRVS